MSRRGYVDPDPYTRLDRLDGLHTRRRAGRHAGPYHRHTDLADAERPAGRHRAPDPVPCLQPMTVPPFEACGNDADPEHPDQLCTEHAERRRS